MCITTHRDNTHQVKLANHGAPGIQVGFAEDNPTATYWILNPKTKIIILTKDMTFNRSHSETGIRLKNLSW